MDSGLALPGMTRRELPPVLPLARQLGDIRGFGFANSRRRARETRRRRGLGDAVAADENLSRRHMRMIRRFAHGQDRREADVGALHDLAPFVAGLGLENTFKLLLQRWPCLAVHLMLEVGVGKAG